MQKSVHFIAIGGSIMHSMAICLKNMGYNVFGSDDEIFDPAKSALAKEGLLPQSFGWFPEKINNKLDFIVLGMHARADNPEYLRAIELGLKVYSFPEFIYQSAIHKQRVVIAGSHGKTSITSMILHVLKNSNKKFDYLVGAKIQGFENQVQITADAPLIIIEGDEYLTSPVDRKPKFLHYFHHIAVISGIAWDHINVFPDFNDYVHQFELLMQMTPKAGKLIYYENDSHLKRLNKNPLKDAELVPYNIHDFSIKNDVTHLKTKQGEVSIEVFGEHNLANISAAKEVCMLLGVDEQEFYHHIKTFKGAARRLELLGENKTMNTSVFRDFAHAPSKVKATTQAVKSQFKNRKLIACFELHTYSSLNKNFLSEYKNTLSNADVSIVYYNPKTFEIKKLEPVTAEQIAEHFGAGVKVFSDSQKLMDELNTIDYKNATLLLMSSGNFDNLDFQKLLEKIK